MEEEKRSASQGQLRSEKDGRYGHTFSPHLNVMNVKLRDLREAQEKRRSPNEEDCRRGYGHIATGTKAPGRGGVSKSPAHTETHRHWGENGKLKAGGRGQKTSVRGPLAGLQEESVVIVKATFIVTSGGKQQE